MGFISYESVGTLNNARSGTITGGITGVAISGYVGTLTNSGNISGTISSGITNDGTIGTLNNSGNITGGAAGIGNSGTIGTLINSGTISGSAMYAIGNEGTLGVIANSGVIAGNIANLTSQNLTINGDTSGAVGAFGTLTGYTDGAIGGIGKITNIDANVVFGAGNLVLNDSINVGAHAVNNTGATLKVNAPMTITGNYNQGAAATLLIGVSAGASAKGLMADTGYGRLVVSGSALISPGATVALSSQSYAFAPGQRFVVVDAASAGTNYNEGTLTYSIRGYKSVLTGANVTAGGRSDLVVTVVSATPFPPPPTPPVITPETPPAPPRAGATTPNAIAALAGLAKYTGISDPALLNLFNAGQALNLGSTASANRAGAQLNPSSPGAISQAVSAPTFSVLNIIAGRSDGMRLAGADGGSGVSTGEAPPAWGVWGQAFGGRASQGEHDMIDGYSANFAGFLIGADRAINDAWRAGGVFSYSNTTIDSTGNTAGNRTRVNAFGLVGYASYIASAWYANLSAGVVQQRYDTSRTIDFTGFSGSANGRFNGTQYVVRAEAGYPLALRFATVTPIASLTYSYLHQSAYTESGGNGAALAVDAAHTTSVTSDFGVKISREFPTVHGTLVPELQVGWRHQYDNSRNATNARFVADPTGAAAFTSLSAHPVSDLAVVQAGLTLLRANNLSVTARYELQVGGGLVSQAGTLRLRQLF
ncbi:hypothetical protein RO07_03950 [Pandoraea pulmonicola]|nr:hypothetical protein RO07_03950 [Pandoraea pulmonicola]